MMTEDYFSAAARHYVDSELLLANKRFDNAGYLAGYTVECCFKAIILHGSRRHPRQYGHDLTALGGVALDLALLLSPSQRRYRSDMISEILQAVGDWDPQWRYSRTGSIPTERAKDLIGTAEKAFRNLIIPLVLDGWGEVHS